MTKLDGIKKQMNFCIETAYKKGFEDGQKESKTIKLKPIIVIDKSGKFAEELGLTWRECEEERKPADHDCKHCSKTPGSLGCCSTVNNEWVYSCEEGHKEYKEKQSKKSCDSCEYKELSSDEIPCIDCGTGYESYTHWAPKKTDEIKIGDEVYSKLTNSKAVILYINSWGYWECLLDDGRTTTLVEKNRKYWVKTGRHFPQIVEVLKQMRGGKE